MSIKVISDTYKPTSDTKKNSSKETSPSSTSKNPEDAFQTGIILTITDTSEKNQHSPSKENTPKVREVNFIQNIEQENGRKDVIQEILQRNRESRKAIQDAFLEKNKNISYNPVVDLTALAAARNTGQVKVIKGRLSRRYSQFKRSQGNQETIRMTLGAIKKIISKANSKIKGLQEEEHLITQQKTAQQRNELEKVKILEKEYMEHKNKRKAKEQNDIMEALKNPSRYGIEYCQSDLSEITRTPTSFVPMTSSTNIIATSISTPLGSSVDISL